MTSIMSLIVQKCLFCFLRRYLSLCGGVCTTAQVPMEAKESLAGAGVTRCWELNLSARQKLSIFFRTETFLQPLNLIFSRIFYMCMAH